MGQVTPARGSRMLSRDTRSGRLLPVPLQYRFWMYVQKTPTCWLWIGAKGSNGYGYIQAGGRLRGAHRVSYELHKGPVANGLQVRHDCDTPLCVNPDHMRLGTVHDNARDKVQRGRMPNVEPPHYSGERHPNAKLSAADVTEIKFLRNAGWAYMPLARLFGVTKQQIANIVKGRQRVFA